jgi:hypothetical protein
MSLILCRFSIKFHVLIPVNKIHAPYLISCRVAKAQIHLNIFHFQETVERAGVSWDPHAG